MSSLINVYFKNGQVIPITCEKFSATSSQIDGSLVSYEITGIRKNKPLYMNLSDVSAIVEEMGNENGNTAEPEKD